MMAWVRRVLLVSGEYPPMEGGVADFTRLVGEAMVERGVEVHVLTSVRGPGPASGSPVRSHPLLSSWSWLPLYGAVRRLLGEIEPDVVNIQYQAAAYGMHPAINLLPFFFPKAPIASTFHDLLVPYLFPKAGPLRWGVNLALARYSRASIVTNAQDEERLARYPWYVGLQGGAAATPAGTRASARHLVRIPIGSNIANALPPSFDRTQWRQRLGLPEDVLVLCYFGFLNSSKGGEELVEALDALVRSSHRVALLMIGGNVGASDPTNRAYLDIVRQSITDRDLGERVVWTGYMSPPEVSASFAASDVCVLPYRDGASFRRGSFMAALTHGMPIISTHPHVALPELVHGENVWLVPPRDAGALTGAITCLASDPALRQRLGAAALALSKQFGWSEIAERTLEVYARIISP